MSSAPCRLLLVGGGLTSGALARSLRGAEISLQVGEWAREGDLSFSITKQFSIEIKLSSIAQSTGQNFPVLPSYQSNTENQLFQY